MFSEVEVISLWSARVGMTFCFKVEEVCGKLLGEYTNLCAY